MELPDTIQTDFIILKKWSASCYKVYFNFNNAHLGRFVRDLDGYFYYIPKDGNGHWNSVSLRYIADALDLINKPHDDQIKEYFKNN
jgi:hypothetical protein